MSEGPLAKKAKNITRLIEEVDLYWSQFHAAMPLRIASAKFSRAFEKVGGFHEIMRELENDGSLVLERHRTGKTLIYPPAAVSVMDNVRRIG